MATRLIIDGNTVYEIDEDRLENFRSRENSCRKIKGQEIREDSQAEEET